YQATSTSIPFGGKESAQPATNAIISQGLGNRARWHRRGGQLGARRSLQSSPFARSGTALGARGLEPVCISICGHAPRPIAAIAALALATIVSAPRSALADEGGVSFWLPGFFGSLAAAPQQPGWSLTSIYYHTSVSAGADVARAREFETGRIPITATANVSASLQARADLGLLMPTYTFATPVFGGQLYAGRRWNLR